MPFGSLLREGSFNMAEIHELEKICSQTHDILQAVTQDLPIPKEDKARDVRKMISVFTYSVIKELSVEHDVHEDDIYLRYLMGGGLSAAQARIIVDRTRDEFTQREFGHNCLSLGKKIANKWIDGNKNIQNALHDLLSK